MFLRSANDRSYVFGKTRSTIANARKEEVMTNTAIEADTASHRSDVGFHFITKGRNLVGKRDTGGKKCIRRVFRHLSATIIHDENWIFGPHERRIQLLNQRQRPFAVATDHHSIWFHEIL